MSFVTDGAAIHLVRIVMASVPRFCQRLEIFLKSLLVIELKLREMIGKKWAWTRRALDAEPIHGVDEIIRHSNEVSYKVYTLALKYNK